MGIAENIIFGLFSVTSIVSGTLAAIFIRKFNQQQMKQVQRGKASSERNFVTNNQLGMVLCLTLYNVALLIAKYNEVFAWNGKVSRWDGEQQEGWFQLPVFIFLDLGIVNGIGWSVILWSKLTSANPNSLAKRFFEFFSTSRQVLFNRFLAALVILSHGVFAALFSEDGGRLYLWCCILMIFHLSLIVLFNIPMAIDLFFLIFHIRRQNRITNSEGSSALAGVIRVFIVVSFSAILATVAIYTTITTTVLKRKDRISRNLTPDAVGDGGMYTGPGITPTIFVYSLFAFILSIPFLFRKEFLPVILGKLGGGGGKDTPQKVTEVKSSKSTTQSTH